MRKAWILFVLCWAMPAWAQQAMPDASQMAGVPLGAPELPDATVSVRVVRQRMGNNIEGQTVTMKGAGLTKSTITDAQGRAQFEGFPAGASVQAEANVDGEVLTSQPFAVPAKGGVRVALVAGLAQAQAAEAAAAAAAASAPARPGIVQFGPDSRIIFEYQNDTLQGFYLLEIVNTARTPIAVDGPVLIDLPPGAAGGSMLQGSSTQASVRGEVVTVIGPFAPGKTVVHIGFTLPNAGASLALRQRFPAALEQAFVAIEKVGGVQMSSPQLADIREMNADGQAFLIGTGARLRPGDVLAVDVTGLPAHSTTARNVALALVVVMLLTGLWAGVMPDPRAIAPGGQAAAQRERMLVEVVNLERQRRRHPLSPHDEARRLRLMTDLERLQAGLDSGPASGGGGVAA